MAVNRNDVTRVPERSLTYYLVACANLTVFAFGFHFNVAHKSTQGVSSVTLINSKKNSPYRQLERCFDDALWGTLDKNSAKS